MWMVTGETPYSRKKVYEEIECPNCGERFASPFCPNCGEKYGMKKRKGNSFFKGTFDNIPFLNDDAKRTFIHLLLRPGYMIRDYINGKTSRYLAPMTALIIFYAFFALMSSIMAPYNGVTDGEEGEVKREIRELKDSLRNQRENIDITVNNDDPVQKEIAEKSLRAASSAIGVFELMRLDEHPELIDSRLKSSLAAVEKSMKEGGITLFLGNLIMLTIALWLSFRKKYGLSIPASAATAAYILCQYCFFMLFVLLATLGGKKEIGLILMTVLMVFDFCQLFGVDRRKGIRHTLKVGLMICLEYVVMVIVVGIIVGIGMIFK